MMRILIADDMEYARANIMELVKNIFPEAEIDAQLFQLGFAFSCHKKDFRMGMFFCDFFCKFRSMHSAHPDIGKK